MVENDMKHKAVWDMFSFGAMVRCQKPPRQSVNNTDHDKIIRGPVNGIENGS